jgi:hypothetical protein
VLLFLITEWRVLVERRTIMPSVKEGPAGFCRAGVVASEHQFLDLARAA